MSDWKSPRFQCLEVYFEENEPGAPIIINAECVLTDALTFTLITFLRRLFILEKIKIFFWAGEMWLNKEKRSALRRRHFQIRTFKH